MNTTVLPIATAEAPPAVGPYSQAVQAGGFLFVAGQLPFDPATGTFVAGGMEARTRRVIENVRAIVRAAGGSLANVVKVTVYLTDMGAFPTVNAVYSEFFRDPLPARVAVQVAALPKGADIEMDAIAWLPPQAG